MKTIGHLIAAALFTISNLEAATSQKITLNFKIENNGSVSHAQIITLDKEVAKMETFADHKKEKLQYSIEAQPTLNNDKSISLKIKGQSKFALNGSSRSFESTITLKAGEEAIVVGSEDSEKNTFKVSVNATTNN